MGGLAVDSQNCCVILMKTASVPATHCSHVRMSKHGRLQWAKAQQERGQRAPIVLLANKPKTVLNDIVDRIRSETRMDIMAREGVPYVCACT